MLEVPKSHKGRPNGLTAQSHTALDPPVRGRPKIGIIAHHAIRRFRAFVIAALLPLLFGSTVVARASPGLTPSLGSGNVTLKPSDYFTGSYALTGSASLLLSANYTLPAGTGADRITDPSMLSLGGLLTISPFSDVFATGQK